MDIVIIGAGNVAHCFGHLMKLHGHQIRQVISRNPQNAEELAELLHARATTDLLDIDLEADVYLLAVSDSYIPVLNDELRLGRRMVAHTAGAVPLSAINKVSINTGVMYPLQSIRKEIKNYPDIPLMLEGNNDEVTKRLQALGQSISSNINLVSSEERLKYHLSAVFCNNFTNHLMALAKDYCETEGLDFNVLHPIIKETFTRLEKYSPEQVQTGPAIRNDQRTMAMHMDLLTKHPIMEIIYPVLSESIYQFQQLHKKD
ncbi:putative short-subunit dehydrogenase-like oxidoreductase (DUF2520 family) [Chitinophaga skermanii]|uniref:Putative short-subunit dehydrogenase-like oxidoreductase (DUF2520 family) n=1 Tax=Chitinophaga skermanii TaxID=331697 RepID=A0A327QL90_9BACT|nr:Rossmann-like and DUF2520 domain-containing protein [Chitinophaga skermanii]RAJ02517.1 putative short-subunit dehydrogenase-like oxidoreductase (DUF2520 family) [Chitinophaga skermanii]